MPSRPSWHAGVPGRCSPVPARKLCSGTLGRCSGATTVLRRTPPRPRTATCPSTVGRRARTRGEKC
eukprot:5584796-Prymnesium_polylepis.1